MTTKKVGGARFSTKPRCGAITRGTDATRGKVCDGHPCLRMAGHGTDHLGSGKCLYHGGATPRKHGLFSRVVPKDMTASYVAVLADPNLNSMREQLALLDGVIIPGALKRGEKAPTHAGEIDPLRLQLQAIDVKSKIVKRLADTEQNRKIAFTPDELRRLIVGLVAVVAEFVDADMLRKISTRIGVLALSAELG
jgi:hypothetical protein